MKIRTITMGFNYESTSSEKLIRNAATALHSIENDFSKEHYTVQTKRMCTQPWNQYVSSRHELLKTVQKINSYAKKYKIDYFNIGPTNQSSQIPWLSEVLSTTENGFCTAEICDKNQIYYESAWEAACLIKKLSTMRSDGFTNLRFAALCNISKPTPFFPASYHMNDSPSFSIGCENSDLLCDSFHTTDSVEDARKNLLKKCERIYQPIEKNALFCAEKYKVSYEGIDPSICSSIQKDESIVKAFESLGLGLFGEPGTLTIAKLITDVLRQLSIKKTGYTGLMLPVLEDYGLAQRVKEQEVSIQKLLLYSSVCGTGLDTVPLPGDISIKKIYALLLDVATLSIKLQKPLSARLMPIPGKTIRDETTFDFEYFVNTSVMAP